VAGCARFAEGDVISKVFCLFGNVFVYGVRAGKDATGEAGLLRYGVLGLLIERRGYGYDLVQRLSQRLGAAWQLNPSTVYTALDQLEEAKLIEAVHGSSDEPPPDRHHSRRAGRVVYEATDRGVAEFRAWLGRPTQRVSPIRSEIQLKVALAGPDNVPPLLASIAQEEWTIARRLHDECQTFGEPPEAPLNGNGTVEEHRQPGHGAGAGWPTTASALVNAAATTRLQAELAWIETVRETLQQMSAEHVSSAGEMRLPDAATLS
jgi:DNA-binding PadR family transcriptional regulator